MLLGVAGYGLGVDGRHTSSKSQIGRAEVAIADLLYGSCRNECWNEWIATETANLCTHERPLSPHKQGTCRGGPAAGPGAMVAHAARSAAQQQLTCVPERIRNECETNVQKLLQLADADGLIAA